MRKALLSLFIACMGLLPCHAAPGNGGVIKIPAQEMDRGDVHGDRPLAPSTTGIRPPEMYDTWGIWNNIWGIWSFFRDDLNNVGDPEWVQISYDSATACLSIQTLKRTNAVIIALRNTTTGEDYSYYIDYLGKRQTISFMGGDGTWDIYIEALLPFDRCLISCGEFYIDNGMIY